LFKELNKFDIEPCKIGYKYNDNLYFSSWFITGGNILRKSENMRKSRKQTNDDENLKCLLDKYTYKNVKDIKLETFTQQVFFNVFVFRRDESEQETIETSTDQRVSRKRKNSTQPLDNNKKIPDYFKAMK